MSVEEIKKGLVALSEAEQSEVTAFFSILDILMILIIRVLYDTIVRCGFFPLGDTRGI